MFCDAVVGVGVLCFEVVDVLYGDGLVFYVDYFGDGGDVVRVVV